MSDTSNNQDCEAMKKLLISWHVEVLYELFKEEDISIEELKMMQLCHINSLLKNYKMGVKIRFEYHFNKWRNGIGIPLQGIGTNQPPTCICNYNKPVCENGTDNLHDNNLAVGISVKKRKVDNEVPLTNNAELEDTQEHLSPPHSVQSEKSLKNTTENNEDVPLTQSLVLGSPTQKANHTDEEGDNDNTLNTLNDFLLTTLDDVPPKFPSKSTPEKCPITLKEILELSGSRGMSIVKFYKKKKMLTNVHRGQLIQTIVDFFDENDYHLSLNISHNLEWEILKMFPTEKLEYYRTEKRGKIYVKFSNMKRYKRERNNKAKSESETSNSRQHRSQTRNNQADCLYNDDMDITIGEAWPEGAEAEIEVKEENIESV